MKFFMMIAFACMMPFQLHSMEGRDRIPTQKEQIREVQDFYTMARLNRMKEIIDKRAEPPQSPWDEPASCRFIIGAVSCGALAIGSAGLALLAYVLLR